MGTGHIKVKDQIKATRAWLVAWLVLLLLLRVGGKLNTENEV